MLGLGFSLTSQVVLAGTNSGPSIDPAFFVTTGGELVTHNAAPVTVETLFNPEALVTHQGAVVTSQGGIITHGDNK